MISEKLLNIIESFENYEIEKNKKDNLEDLLRAERRLRSLDSKLDRVNSSAIEYEVDSFDQRNSLREELQRGKRDLSAQKIQHMNEVILNLEKHIELIDESLKDQWNRLFLEKYKSKINLLKTLYSVIDDLELVEISHYMEQYGKKDIVKENDLDDLKTLEEHLDKKIKSLNLNLEIELFLNKLVNNKATLEDLNKETLDWLKEKDILKRIDLTTNK